MQASSKDNKKRLTLNQFPSNLVPWSDYGNRNLSLGFSKTVKEFWNLDYGTQINKVTADTQQHTVFNLHSNALSESVNISSNNWNFIQNKWCNFCSVLLVSLLTSQQLKLYFMILLLFSLLFLIQKHAAVYPCSCYCFSLILVLTQKIPLFP